MKSHLLSLCQVAGGTGFGAEAQTFCLDGSRPIETRAGEKGDFKNLAGGSSHDIHSQGNYQPAETVFGKN
jgi:hypothetical protein